MTDKRVSHPLSARTAMRSVEPGSKGMAGPRTAARQQLAHVPCDDVWKSQGLLSYGQSFSAGAKTKKRSTGKK
eukprot:scaffold242517_cov32-Tisochrysis_lutea.AAC.1